MFSGDTKVEDKLGSYTLDDALEGARVEAQLNDFGDDVFVEPLDMLIQCAMNDISFTHEGLHNFKATIQRYLVNRLRLQRDLKLYPEILEEDVSDPIMILGMPRTGTTMLQRLMSTAPNVQKLSLWRVLNPAPFQDEKSTKPAGRRAFAKLVEDATQANETFKLSHEHLTDEAEEDSILACQGIDYAMNWHMFPSDSFLVWARSRPQIEAHRYEKRLLQYLQWQDGGRRDRRWILKNPGGIGYLRQLHEVFPKATFVHSHRNLLEVMPSFCRLMSALQEPLIDISDLNEFAQKQIAYWAADYRKYNRDRAEMKSEIEIIDVPYTQVVGDPIGVTKMVFDRAGVQLTEEGVAELRTWLDANKQHKHGKAEYSMEQYGLSEEGILEAFGTLDG